MTLHDSYKRNKAALLLNESICEENRQLWQEFFEYEEYKLKRKNSIPSLDEGCIKTLLTYVQRFKNLNNWLGNKPWVNLAKADIKQVYDRLEEGKIMNCRGKPVADRMSYYSKIMKSKPFKMAGKADLAAEVLEFYKPSENREVRFISEEIFRKIEMVINKVEYKALVWLSWDIGENINSLLRLRRKDFKRQSVDGRQPEYAINFPKNILKRSRTPRTELTNYQETVQYLDIILEPLDGEEHLFSFGYASSRKFLNRAIRKTHVKCVTGHKPTWKDFRSGMACHLLKIGWTRDEINARLGHKPSSPEIDKYITFLAIDRRRAKVKHEETTLIKLKDELEEVKLREKSYVLRIDRMLAEFDEDRKEKEQQIRILQDEARKGKRRDAIVLGFIQNRAKKGKIKDILKALYEEGLEEELLQMN
jgi:hypothetical protein